MLNNMNHAIRQAAEYIQANWQRAAAAPHAQPGSGPEPLPLPALVQIPGRRDPQAIPGSLPPAGLEARASPGRRRPAGDLRRRIRVHQPRLRTGGYAPGHDAFGIPRGRGARRDYACDHTHAPRPGEDRRDRSRLVLRRVRRIGRRVDRRTAARVSIGRTGSGSEALAGTSWRMGAGSGAAPGRCAAQLDLPLDIRATAFQMQVWRYLQSIPYGETRSYRSVAEGIGRPTAARAVAAACARNRVALVIPCHRVIRGTVN